jgi:hypothetical protein
MDVKSRLGAIEEPLAGSLLSAKLNRHNPSRERALLLR